MFRFRSRFSLAAAASLVLLLAACNKTTSSPVGPPTTSAPPATSPTGGGGGGSGSPSAHPSHTPTTVPPGSPIPTESNPPGDIPDNIRYVPFHSSAGHFTISIPEGWSRRSSGTKLTFTDEKLNTVTVEWAGASSAPSVASAKANDIPGLRSTERAFQLEQLQAHPLPGGPSVQIVFLENSPPIGTVTTKQYRLEVQRFELFHAGVEAVITLSAPVGRDNVDPWRIISESFRWQ